MARSEKTKRNPKPTSPKTAAPRKASPSRPAHMKASKPSTVVRPKHTASPADPATRRAVTGNAANFLPPSLQLLLDKAEVADRLYAAARGLDRMDETVLRSVFHPDASVDLGPGIFQGTSHDYVAWILGVLQGVRSTHHMIGNVQATVEGDVAFVESYAQVHYRLDKPTGREDVFMGVRFLDRLERRLPAPAGVWKIVHRKQILDWVRTEAVSDIFYHQNPDALWSARTKTDPSYQMRQFPGGAGGGKMPTFIGRRYESKSIRL